MSLVTKIHKGNIPDQTELVRINKGGIHLRVVIFTGKEGDYFVTISPSLNVSGYGKTKKEAQKSFNENINLFCGDLFALSVKNREIELRKLGFRKDKIQHKNFSKMYVDSNGVLQNFEEGTVERTIHQATTCA